MNKENNIDFADLIIIFLKWKKSIVGLTFISVVLAYLAVFYLVEEQYDASTTIIPSEENTSSMINSLLGGLGDMPFNLGGIGSSPEVGMFKTIINSRTLQYEIVYKYNLYEVFKIDSNSVVDYRKRVIENLSSSILTEETEDGAFVIKVRMPRAKLAADITNYIVKRLNESLIDMKVVKSRDNRIFLEKRLAEIRLKLRESEDALMEFQKESNILSAPEQLEGILGAYTKLETDILAKQMQLSIAEKIYPKDAPQTQQIRMEVDEFNKQLKKIKSGGLKESPLVAYSELPAKVIGYFRLFRDVEINQTILKFILPLYEQAKIEEQKDIPILRVVDRAEVPAKKSWPPRSLLAILVGMFAFLFIYFAFMIKENAKIQNSEKYQFIKRNLLSWNTEKYN